MTRSGIVLAGGAGRRFGRDKLAEPIDGIALLTRAVQALAGVVDEIIVVIAPDRAPPPLGPVDVCPPVRYVADLQPFGGPLVGVRTGLAAAHGQVTLIVGGDMPSMVPGVLELLLAGPPAALADSTGLLRPLPCAIEQASALAIADELLAGGERRLRALLARLGAVAVPWAEWRGLDPAGLTLVDIDEPADLPGNARDPDRVDRGLAGGGARSRGEEEDRGEKR